MQILQTLQKSFDSIGYSRDRAPFNRIVSTNLGRSVPAIIFMWMSLFREARTSQELMESIYFIVASMGNFYSCIATILTRNEMFSLIDCSNDLFNKSEYSFNRLNILKEFRHMWIYVTNELGLENPTSKAICRKTNHRVEKISKVCVFAMENVMVPCFIIPKTIRSFFIYFSTDLGRDAFDLPIPMW